jgi:hypothetical protein
LGANDTIYDYGPYDRALSDAALWEVKAEERIAWSAEAVLFDNNPGMYSHGKNVLYYLIQFVGHASQAPKSTNNFVPVTGHRG